MEIPCRTLLLVFLLHFNPDGSFYYVDGSKVEQFNASSLIRALYNNDIASLVEILTKTKYNLRSEIVAQFKDKVGKRLKDELERRLPDDALRDLLVGLALPSHVFYANELYKAIDGLGTDESVLIQILCTLTYQEMLFVMAAYESEFDRTLVDDVKDDTSGDLKMFFVSLLDSRRDDGGTVHKERAAVDARRLLKAGIEKVGTDESVFYEVLSTRNVNQLRLIFDNYKELSGHDIEKAIEMEFSWYIKEALLTFVAATRSLPVYFATRLDACMYGKVKDHRQLVRIIVRRFELDMSEIKKEYVSIFHVHLKADIYAHTEGLFQAALLNLIGLE
ncbi:hypothetical protein PPYR_11449 [Photinus pyralis]|uniref:Annexin n=1 Tax=Photinus pyralis TaxID=7054 RepID=A0A5N4ABA6_PHOPY|nr:annexin A13-like [Photinus pyralis]KAB0794610.1 hypothetical protein PPYR_11449 [Photinus pyralis]